MEFFKWTIFIALFAFSENAPVTENSLIENDITRTLIALTRQIALHTRNKGTNETTPNEEFEGNAIKATIKPVEGYAEIKFQSHTKFRIETLFNVSLGVKLRDFNHHFVTEEFPAELGLVFSNEGDIVENNGRITKNYITSTKLYYPNGDHIDIKLLPNEYQYKPNEEESVKQLIKSLIKNITRKYAENTEYPKSIARMIINAQSDFELEPWLKNFSQPLDTIPGAGYTLNNVTLCGLWNLQGISYNTSNLEASPQLEVGQVTGTIVMEFKSGIDPPVELSFSASNIRMSMNQKADRKVDVQISGYSLKNTKTNALLTDDESKTIVNQIESAIAASNVVSGWKKYNF